ncbi:MAG: hypothetical protein A2021_05660 [Elusimicrobia bacterium GWF2_52_66]|nr:MAG: hypothetical protein A2X33_07190 [Elusimicrobia bacterium GWA2_51_34]OGR88441.1 MAG: hypothetical protein A2021_05660 [Elusimicrobia bacterium GWF2_52_66]HAF95315.1 hypothetical protein [Elusimicrobiota bacterium]HCE96913.1 hypothetical protein [Elusimicrobiota bacterium]
MNYVKKNRVPLTSALLAVYLLFSAPMTSAAQPPEPGAWAVAGSSMQGMEDMPGMADEQPGAPEKLTPYQTGVQLYLKGSDGEAISQLEEALRLDASDEKAKRLLLKVMLRAINGNYERNNYAKAHLFIQAARKYFPDNPEVKLLYSAMSESNSAVKQKIPAARPENPPIRLKRTIEVRRSTLAPAPAPAPQKTVQAPAVSMQNPAARAPSGSWPGNAAYLAVTAAALFIFIYSRRKQEKDLLRRIESLQKALVDGEVRNAEIYKELERWKNLEEQNKELSELRKSREERMYLELEKLKAEEEAKIMAELALKRREAERAASPAPEAGKNPFSAPCSQGTGEVSALPAESLPAGGPKCVIPPPACPETGLRPKAGGGVAAGPQENNILKMLAGITPPEREAAWKRIAARAADLYETSPEETIKFLYNLAKDENPLNRASIAGALAVIGAPATLDILFELYNDASMEVRREAIKHLTGLQRNLTVPIDEAYREKIAGCLREEKEKGDWVF